MEKAIFELKSKLKDYKTEDVLGFISTKLFPIGIDGEDISKASDVFQKTSLHSPLKQYLYLAGLLVTTEYNKESQCKLTEEVFTDFESGLQKITDMYMASMGDVLLGKLNASQDEKNMLYPAFEYFDSYFNTGSLNYPEQVINRIKLLFSPFNIKIKNILGVTADEIIDFYFFVYDEIQKSLDRMCEAIEEMTTFLDNKQFIIEEDTFFSLRENVNSANLFEIATGMLTVKKSNVINRFGLENATKLINIFTIKRQNQNFNYYAFEDNPFVKQPLVWINDEHFFVMYPPLLIERAYTLLNNELSKDLKFVEKKGKLVEDLTANILKKLFGPKAKLYKGVCEKLGTDEHDLLIIFDNYVFIVEIKGSKVKMPRKDIEKSSIYLREHFFGPSGIGYAYNQAIKLKEFLEQNKISTLFINKNESIVIDTNNKTILPIVITLEQFGKIEINTSLLIKPKEKQPYPWACCIDDLENILMVNEYLKKSPEEFINYIIFRQKWHSNIFASDELELLEDYYAGKFKKIKDNIDYFIQPRGTSLVDKIYFESHGAIYNYDYKK